MKIINKMHIAIVLVSLSSSSCAALMGMMGSAGSLMGGAGSGAAGALGGAVNSFTGLTEQSSGDLMLSSNDVNAGKLGYVVRASNSLDPKADDNYLYGLYKDPNAGSAK